MKGLTRYQFEALRHIADPGLAVSIDFDQLLDKLSWQPSKQSAQFIIRALIAKKLILKVGTEMRRGRHRVVFKPTFEGLRVMDPRMVPVSETSVSDDLEEGLEDLPGVL